MDEKIRNLLLSEITLPEVKARFVFMMRVWRQSLFSEKLENMPLKKKRSYVNQWLNKMETMFVENETNINILSGFKGYMSAGSFGVEDFIKDYNEKIINLTNKDVLWARLQRNSLASRIKDKGVSQLYSEFDRYLIEAKALGLTRDEIVKNFMNTKAIRETTLTDSIGRKWKPDNYVRMYSNTRDGQMRDELFTDQTLNLGYDVVQVSSHRTGTAICQMYEGKFYSLTGQTPGIPLLPARPPFHPNCKHVLVRRHKLSNKEMRKINFFLDKDSIESINKLSTSQKKTVKKQQKWNDKNRPPSWKKQV